MYIKHLLGNLALCELSLKQKLLDKYFINQLKYFCKVSGIPILDQSKSPSTCLTFFFNCVHGQEDEAIGEFFCPVSLFA